MDTRSRRLSQGLCPSCGGPPAPGRQQCEACLARHRARYHDAVALGLCGMCGKSPRAGALKVCQTCHNDMTARRQARLAAGCCISCQRRPRLDGLSQCERCLGYRRRQQERYKEGAYQAYGGYRCNCCGETQRMFLTIDHVHNDGNVHRKQLGVTGRGSETNNLYAWLSKHNYPPGFQVLCRNCNWGKHANGGVCPHKSPPPDRPAD